MHTILRQHSGQVGFSSDYLKVHDFLVRLNREKMNAPNFPWGRWAWMFCLERYLDTRNLNRIGIWEAAGDVVGLVTYESAIGDARFCVDPDFSHLKEEMLDYAMANMKKEDGSLRILIPDSDTELQALAARKSFSVTGDGEPVSVLALDEPLQEALLPEGYATVSLDDEYDLKKYNRVLHRGFNHEEPVPETKEVLSERAQELSGPYTDLTLKIAVKAANGEFVSYCGMWYLEGLSDALVEPVATDPSYRRKGLGKAAVLEACRRCRDRGAKVAYVGSSQQFYYSIGFKPYSHESWWKLDI